MRVYDEHVFISLGGDTITEFPSVFTVTSLFSKYKTPTPLPRFPTVPAEPATQSSIFKLYISLCLFFRFATSGATRTHRLVSRRDYGFLFVRVCPDSEMGRFDFMQP